MPEASAHMHYTPTSVSGTVIADTAEEAKEFAERIVKTFGKPTSITDPRPLTGANEFYVIVGDWR